MTKAFGCLQQQERIGVLIAQLGTPDAPTAPALRKYLRQFLGDPRVIEKNRLLWWIILNAFILPRRPAKSAELYRRIWKDGEGSPLLLTTREQAAGLAERLKVVSPDIVVDFGMRYGSPSLEAAVDRLIDEHHCSRILLFSMYPQYSATTTASNYDAFFAHILKRRSVPSIRLAEPFYRDRRYITALARTINGSLAPLDWMPDRLFLSYHGIPLSYRNEGDPYCCHCTETTEAVRGLIQLPPERITQVFQSRFGRDPWLTPYTDMTIEAAVKNGERNIAIACPGFTTDCLETIDEMGTEVRHLFTEAGGDKFALVPCLNAEPHWLDAMASIVQDELAGWIGRDEVLTTNIRCPVDGRCNSNTCSANYSMLT